MKNAGFTNYTEFLRAVLGAVDAHAKAANWLPVAYNLGDEPLGDAVPKSISNAKAWREAAPPAVMTTGATSTETADAADPHLQLAKSLKNRQFKRAQRKFD